MAVRKFNPITPGMRHKVLSKFDNITTDKPHKPLLEPLRKNGGRNNDGKMTMRYRGGGHKRMYRVIDFKRNKHGVAAEVLTVEYDPNRSARIALVQYADGEKRYIVAPEGLQVGQQIMSGEGAAPEVGNALFLSDIPLGTMIHNIELKPGHGGQYARSAGTFGVLIQKTEDGKYAQIRLKSKEQRLVPLDCMATIGIVSNLDHGSISLAKAGRSRWLRRRPTVRGVAMNPVDHPHGGGEGKTSGGRPSVSPWGKLTKGPKTRSPRKNSDLILQKRKR